MKKETESKSVKQRLDEISDKYSSIGSVYCKAIRSNVIFNRHGWKHLVYKGNKQRRNKADALLRIGAFSWVVETVKHTQTISTEIRYQRINGRVLPVTYHELQYTFHKKSRDVKIVVVLRQIDDGDIHYYSVRYGKR